MINWRNIEKEAFERLVEHLILLDVERENPGWVADALEGRGGDGGRDIDVRESRGGRIVRIYQLKYFPEGMTGNFKTTRQKQVEKSFKTAQAHAPEEWILVVPAKLTTGSRRFVEELGGSSTTKIKILDSTRLDSLCAKYPQVETWAEKGPLREALALTGQVQAVLANPEDLDKAVRGLKDRVDARSPYWTVDFESRAGQTVQTLVAKRPDAAEKEPLSLVMKLSRNASDPLRLSLSDAMDFGLFEPLMIGSDSLEHLEQQGPEWFARVVAGGEVTIHPASMNDWLLEHEVKLVLENSEGKHTGTYVARSARATAGSVGGQLQIHFPGGVEILIKVAFVEGGESKIALKTAFNGINASEVARGFKLTDAFRQAATARILVDGQPMTGGTLNTHGGSGSDAEWSALGETIRDLNAIQELTNTDLHFDAAMRAPSARKELRIARLILEGKATVANRMDQLQMEVDVEASKRSLAFESFCRDGGFLKYETDSFDIDLGGQIIPLGDVCFFFGQARVGNPEETLDAITQTTQATVEVNVHQRHPELGTIVYSPSRRQDQGPLDPVPWGLTGIEEIERHKSIAREPQ